MPEISIHGLPVVQISLAVLIKAVLLLEPVLEITGTAVTKSYKPQTLTCTSYTLPESYKTKI